jgi:hypothetical protein
VRAHRPLLNVSHACTFVTFTRKLPRFILIRSFEMFEANKAKSDKSPMRKLSALLVLMFVGAVPSFAACHAVGPSASGNGSGSDWNNRMKLPSTLVRGDTYYLADGAYGSYSMNGPTTGTAVITLKKAQSYDFGRTADGCSNDISTGWNPASMGAGQAQFVSIVAALGIHFVTLDGNGHFTGTACGLAPSANQPASDCGIKLGPIPHGSETYLFTGSWNNGSTRNNNWTIRYIEGQGGGDGNNVDWHLWNEEDMTFRDGANNLLIERSFLHDSGCDFVKIPETTGATWRYNYIKHNYEPQTGTPCHSQLILVEVNASNVDFHDNIIEDIVGTSIWSTVTGGQSTNWNIYNNVLWLPINSTSTGLADGLISCVNPGASCTGFKFIGNTLINVREAYTDRLGMYCDSGPCNATWQNNLYYGITAGTIGHFGVTVTSDHNSYLNSGVSSSSWHLGPSDIVVPSGSPDPFVDWQNLNFKLTGQNANWSGGAILAAPYNVDIAGSQRPGPDGVWNRGAFEFTGTQAQAPAPPSGLSASIN